MTNDIATMSSAISNSTVTLDMMIKGKRMFIGYRITKIK